MPVQCCERDCAGLGSQDSFCGAAFASLCGRCADAVRTRCGALAELLLEPHWLGCSGSASRAPRHPTRCGRWTDLVWSRPFLEQSLFGGALFGAAFLEQSVFGADLSGMFFCMGQHLSEQTFCGAVFCRSRLFVEQRFVEQCFLSSLRGIHFFRTWQCTSLFGVVRS